LIRQYWSIENEKYWPSVVKLGKNGLSNSCSTAKLLFSGLITLVIKSKYNRADKCSIASKNQFIELYEPVCGIEEYFALGCVSKAMKCLD
jgi:hypothetical protein